MRDPKRINEVLDAIKEVWEKYPDLRLGQLIDLSRLNSNTPSTDVFSIEDDNLLIGINLLTIKIDTMI